MKKQNVYTVKEATQKLMRYCIYRERCHKEVEQKLSTFQLTPHEQQEVISNLLADNFLNEERFAKIFAYDKFNLKKWGKKRIQKELKYREISAYLIQKAMLEIDETEYLKTFHEVFNKKLHAINEKHPLKIKKKLMDYMLRKGYEYELIYDEFSRLKF